MPLPELKHFESLTSMHATRSYTGGVPPYKNGNQALIFIGCVLKRINDGMQIALAANYKKDGGLDFVV